MRNFIVKLFLNSVAVLLASHFLSGGVHVISFGYAILVALTLSILNVSVKPLLVLFTLPATILSLGVFLLVINTVIIKIAAYLLYPYFIVDSWWWAFFFSITAGYPTMPNSTINAWPTKPKFFPGNLTHPGSSRSFCIIYDC